MATSQHPLILRAVAGCPEGCERRLSLCFLDSTSPPLARQRRASTCLTHARRSEPPSSQAASSQEQESQNPNPNAPSWAQPGSSEPPPWERKQAASAEPGFEIPYYGYLLASVVVAIAAVGSIFEYFNKKPVFGAILPDNPFYAPMLGFFVFGGFPAAAFLWFKSIKLANKAARDQDREDGFLD